MTDGLFLGFDTSNYTTSIAVADASGVIFNGKAPLPVKPGECGLRQSDALFAHVKNLPELTDRAREALAGKAPVAVGVSERPRNHEGSYMPCFLAGVASASAAALTAGAPLYRFSHQCGHLRAALYSAGAETIAEAPFGAFHISGGTTEMLFVRRAERGFVTEIVGGTRDLNAGQLIDRTGVMLGLPFPCGPALEALAAKATGKIPRKKVKTEDGFIHLSGIENTVRDLYEKTGDAPLTAAFLLQYLSDAVIAMSRDLLAKYGDIPVLYAGGVMADAFIRQNVTAAIPRAYFAAPAFSADNAAGIALLTRDAYTAQR